MAATTPFQTLFAVPMTCDSCVKSVSESLYKLNGVVKIDVNLKEQLVSIEGTAPPSAIVEAIEATGKDAILRGSGASNSAAVCILESFHEPAEGKPAREDGESDREVRGLARMVQTSPAATLIDLTLRGVTPGTYVATIREYGDLQDGATSTGPVWSGDVAGRPSNVAGNPRGLLGRIQVDNDGRGSVFLSHPLQVWEIIGHAMVVSPQIEADGSSLQNDRNTVVGVIARSAGMWDNDKIVCSCTGKTLWDERKDEVKKGML